MALLQKHLDRLKNKVAWISGGKRIGQSVALALAEQGVHIVLTYLQSRDEAEKTAAQVERLGVHAWVAQTDVSRRAEVAKTVEAIRQKFKTIDILVNMASVFDPIAFDKIGEAQWEGNIGAHILGTFWPTQLAAPLMPRGSHIINIADRTSAGPVYKDYLPYVVAKGAVHAMTRACAKELAGKGIFVNAIAPGPILPPPYTPASEWEALRASSPLHYPIDDTEAVEQFAILVLYLSIVTLSSGGIYALDQGQNL